MSVTPHVGVWIETTLIPLASIQSRVTPHVGVWIETLCSIYLLNFSSVTPHVGVWIETSLSCFEGYCNASHTSCRCVD